LSGNERSTWLFMRLSAVVLLFAALGHLLYMHLGVGVENIDYDWVLARWSSPVWRLYDWFLLTFAVAHGAVGVRTIMSDYLPGGASALAARWLLYVAAIAILMMGTQIVLTAPTP
jgi:succinate dehydrogenase / fumarate reductase membrane anchor subunit